MSAHKHTPGPWFQGVGDHKNCVYDKRVWINPDGSRGGDTPNIVVVVAPDSAVADARLIAAAPELLQACMTFAEWLRREEAGSDGQPWKGKRDTPEGEAAWREWWEENLRLCSLAQEQARAAIAKATGGAA